MKIASYVVDGRSSWGLVEGDRVRDAGAWFGTGTVRSHLSTGSVDRLEGGLEDAEVLDLSGVQLLPSIPDAGKVLCVGLNYADHIAEMKRETPAKPTIFTRFNDSLVGDGESLVAPRNSGRFDYEGEFAVVIGKGGRHIDKRIAHQHILGYSIMNDGSMRDYQRHTTQFTPGKNFPNSGSLGPWIVTADEFGPIEAQLITTHVNDVLVQKSSLDELVFGVPELIAYISEWTDLSPGDVIATGTPGGVGDGREPALYLLPGDVVTVEVAGIGSLTNPVIEER